MFHRKKTVWLYLAPGLIGLMAFYFVPFVWGMWFSLTDGSIDNRYVGFANYERIWQNPMFQLGLRNTLELSLLCAPLIFVLSFLLASMLRKRVAADGFFRNALLIPYLMPSAAMLIIWQIIFDYGGIINRLFVTLGLERVMWLEGSAMRVPILVLYVWKNLGFSVVIFTAALQAVPEALYEYASLEGAGYLRREWYITLPQVLPTAFLVLVLAIVNAFKIFKEVYIIGGAYPDETVYTLQHYMNNMFSKLEYQAVTTAAYSFAVVVIILFLLMYRAKSVRQGEAA
ncbi:MAG: sugar ABC transporter permease [Candidatus Limiplasma sp.]|nr:sugar ABC transporter permease [Candidatus Limiplasma sp.]